MSSKGSNDDDDDDDDDDMPPKPPVTVPEGATWIDVREVTPVADSEPDQPHLRWCLDGDQTGWELTFRITVMVEKAEG
jgi:hypothetical protein